MFVQHLPEKRRPTASKHAFCIEWGSPFVTLPTATKGNSMGGGIWGRPVRASRESGWSNGELGDLRGVRSASQVRNPLPRNERELGGHDEI